MVSVRIPSALRGLTGGQTIIEVDGRTVKEALQALTERYPALKERLKDEDGNVSRFLNIYLNDEDIRFIKELETPVKDGDRISIIPALAGGQDATRTTLFSPETSQ